MQHLLGTAVGPHLLQLRLHGIKLTGTVALGMHRTPWSVLTKLTLCNCWPKLTYLSLADNGMNGDCAIQLISGDWPLLATVDLSYNGIGADGSARLAAADWPHLEHLCLCRNKPECCGCVVGKHVQETACVPPVFMIC